MPADRNIGKIKLKKLGLLPYEPFGSPTDEEPAIISGSNVRTGIKGYVERRPGIINFAGTFPGTVERIFFTKEIDSSVGALFCVTTSTTSKVYFNNSSTLLYTATATDGEPFDFIQFGDYVYFGNGTTADMKKVNLNDATVTKWGITAPASAPSSVTLTGTGINGAVGYVYAYTYYNSTTGHESSPSPLSAATGVFTNQTVQFGVTASTDTQVSNIRIYRSTDGGSQAFRDLRLHSTVANSTATINDTTADTSLSSTTFCPGQFDNDPPVGMKGFADLAGRIAGFSGNTLYYSGREEISNGVPEECFPGGGDGNFEDYPSPITGVASIEGPAVAVFSIGRIDALIGDTLDTIRKDKISDRQGCRNRQSIVSYQGTCFFFDSSNQVWRLGDSIDIGLPIRTDLDSLTGANVQLAIHLSGEYHWLLVLDTSAGRMFVYDFDTKQWMPPWDFPNGCTAIGSGEFSGVSSVIQLLLADSKNSQVGRLVTSSYTDNSTAFSASLRTNLLPFGDEAVLDYVLLKRNSIEPQCKVLFDDNPSPDSGTNYTNITPYRQEPDKRPQGTELLEDWFKGVPEVPIATTISVDLEWAPADSNFELYELHIGARPV